MCPTIDAQMRRKVEESHGPSSHDRTTVLFAYACPRAAAERLCARTRSLPHLPGGDGDDAPFKKEKAAPQSRFWDCKPRGIAAL
jgi:hypothetical protein